MHDKFAKLIADLDGKKTSNRKLPTKEELDALERALEISFPEPYRFFLQHFSDVTVVASTPTPERDGLYIEDFYGFPTEHQLSDDDVLRFDEAYLAPVAVTIGYDAFGGQFLMFLNKPAHGRIYFYDTEGEGGDFQEDDSWMDNGASFDDLPKFDGKIEKPPEFRNLIFVAEDIFKFFEVMEPLHR